MTVPDAQESNLSRIAALTGKLEQEEHLRHVREQLLIGVLEEAPFGIVVCDRQGEFIIWNTKASELLGKKPGELTTDTWSESILSCPASGELKNFRDFALSRALLGETVGSQRLRVGFPPNDWLISISAKPVYCRVGDLMGAVAMFMDSTS